MRLIASSSQCVRFTFPYNGPDDSRWSGMFVIRVKRTRIFEMQVGDRDCSWSGSKGQCFALGSFTHSMPCCILKKNRTCAQHKVEVTKSKRGSKVEVDGTMRWVRGEVQVNQFDILYINREHALPEQFPLRVKFLADASKNVAAKCEKKLAICSNIQTLDARFEELCRGSGGR